MSSGPQPDETLDPDASFGTTIRPMHSLSGRATEADDEPAGEVDWTKLMGSQAERYEYIRRLGAGGMGMVYLAHDKKLQRKVAIKAIRGMASERMYLRLMREAQALAKLSHPNVVQVYDVDVIEDELRVTMEYIEGRNLREWLATSQPDLQAILAVFIKAAEGLAAAHKANLIHRDFKPDNVLIDVEGQVRVADFGIARSNDEPEPEPESPANRQAPDFPRDLTQTGQFLGTPAYMAPELFHDKLGARGDALSDQYAFCVSLYEALYGELPFQARTFWALVTTITDGEIQEPDPTNVRVPVIPKAVKAAILRGMARDPTQRFATMTELRTALGRAAKAARRSTVRLVTIGSSIALVLAASAAVAAHQLDARAYARECLIPARTLSATGTRQGLDTARETMVRCEVGRGRSTAAAELLRVDSALLYGAGDEPPPRKTIDSSRDADAIVAGVGAELWQIGLTAHELELGDYTTLWEQVRARARPWLDALERAASKDPRRSVAPENHLWLTALIVALAPEAGLDAAELDARLDSAIERTRDHVTGKPQYLLIRFRAELEQDHERAAMLLGRHLDEQWKAHEGSAELVELLLAEQAYRLALAADSSDDHQLRERAQAATRVDAKPLSVRSARLDLAELVLALQAEAEPGKLRADLDRSLGDASRLWWDARFIDALRQAETRVVAREAEANADALRDDLLGAYYRHKSLAAADAIVQAHGLQAAGDDHDELQRLIADAEAELAEAIPTTTEVDTAAPKPARPKQLPRVQVTFNKGDFNGAEFEIQGVAGTLEAVPNLAKTLTTKARRVRCRALHSTAWTEWTSVTPEAGVTIRCTKQGVKIGR